MNEFLVSLPFNVALVLLLFAAVSCRAEKEAVACNLEVSVEERQQRIGLAILAKLGLETLPPSPPTPAIPTPRQADDLSAVQQLQSMDSAKKPSCTEQNAFARTKRPSFPLRASASSSYYDDAYETTNSDEYSGYGDHLIDKRYDPQSSSIPPSTYRFTFPINLTSTDDRQYISSELILLRKVSSRGRHFLAEKETLKVNFLYKEYIFKKGRLLEPLRREFVETKVVDVVNDYVSFNVTHAVNKWIETGRRVSGEIILEVFIQAPVLIVSGLPLSPVIEFDLSDNRTAQLVLTFARPESIQDTSRSSRSKRQESSQTVTRLDTQFCFARPTEPNCCVRALTVNFANDLGYTWISSPTEYRPNYCTGLCTFLWPSASNSTAFLSLYKERNPTFAVEPCCSPEELRPLSVLINVGDSSMIQSLPDMIVGSCICR